MTPVYRRTENDTVTHVSVTEGLAEIDRAMTDKNREVRTMASINRTDYAIEYRDGRNVRLTRTEAPAETEAAEAPEWSSTRTRPFNLHRFDADLRAKCNRRIHSRGAARRGGVLVGHHELRTRAELDDHGYTFCPRCEAL